MGTERREVACRGDAKLERARLGRTRASCENGEQEQATQGRANFTGAAFRVKERRLSDHGLAGQCLPRALPIAAANLHMLLLDNAALGRV